MRITNEELIQIIKEELEAVIDEKKGKKRKAAKKKRRKKKKAKKAKKKDACYRKVKARYKVWPSAYASGALVTCRKKGAKNWGNKSESLDEEFKPHDMYDPETGEKHKAKKKEDHVDMAGKGFVHVDPDELRDILDDEGGAAGLEPLVKGTESEEEEVEKALDQMPDVGKHEKGDYIKGDKKKIRIVKETKSYSITLDVMKDYVKLKYPKKDLSNMTDQEIRDAYYRSLGVDKDEPSAEEFEKMKALQEAKNCGCGKNPCKTYGRQ